MPHAALGGCFEEHGAATDSLRAVRRGRLQMAATCLTSVSSDWQLVVASATFDGEAAARWCERYTWTRPEGAPVALCQSSVRSNLEPRSPNAVEEVRVRRRQPFTGAD
jgi:hypothetical protein